MKNIKRENGSMAVYVSVVLLTMLFILFAIFLMSNSIRRSQIETIIRVKQSYEDDNSKAVEIYKSLVN